MRRDTTHFDFEGKSFRVYEKVRDGACCAHIYAPLGNGHHIDGQCSKAGSKKHGERLFCGTHYPPNVIAREAVKRDRREREREANAADWKKREAAHKLRERCVAAIKLIAEGHNDPRALAREALAGPEQAGSRHISTEPKG